MLLQIKSMQSFYHAMTRLAMLGIWGIALLLLTPATTYAATNCATQTDISQLECETLVALYNSTNGTGWSGGVIWNQNQFPCVWPGIVCTGAASPYNIQVIDLNNRNLVGTLPLTLSNLTELEELYLVNNQLSGPIPLSLSSLNLTQLALDNNCGLSAADPTLLAFINTLNPTWRDGCPKQAVGGVAQVIDINVNHYKVLNLIMAWEGIVGAAMLLMAGWLVWRRG